MKKKRKERRKVEERGGRGRGDGEKEISGNFPEFHPSSSFREFLMEWRSFPEVR